MPESIRRSFFRYPKVAVSLASVMSLAASAQSADGNSALSIGANFTMTSQVLGENRNLLISLPDYYPVSNERYAVLYLLDGVEHFPHVATLVEFLAQAEIVPELIVVGVGNTDRSRDFYTATADPAEGAANPTAGGAEAFARFLREELVPWTNERYRTSGYDVLFGHSAGGYFALHSMLDESDPFDAYIVASPAAQWDGEILRRRVASGWDAESHAGESLFLALGDEGQIARDEVGRFVDTLASASASDASFRWTFESMELDTHWSIPHRAAQRGLEFTFDGWFVRDALALFDDVGIAGIHAHYADVDRRFGYGRGTPANVIRQLGGRLLEAGRLEEVAEIVRYDPVRYPTHPNNIDQLAARFLESGNRDRAVELYSLALGLSPGNALARDGLAALGIDVDALVDEFALSESALTALAGNYRMPNGSVFTIGIVDRGLVLDANGGHEELIMLSPTEFTVGPGLLYFEFMDDGVRGSPAMRVRTPRTGWEATERLN